jgi:hypothetical protein
MSPLFSRRPQPPAALTEALDRDEALLANVSLVDGGWLAVSRFGLWIVPVDGPPHRIGWPMISKAVWQPPVLRVTTSEVVGMLADAELIEDRAPIAFELAKESRLTDQVHQRVRNGIVAAEHADHGGHGWWLVLRRVPGRDGLTAQVRADPGADLTVVTDHVATHLDRLRLEHGTR